MQMTLAANLLEYLNPLRLAGPIFDKELRVASRRRRLYVVRFAFVAVLAVFVLWLWRGTFHFGGAYVTAVQVSRQGQIGQRAVLAIAWLEFFAGQFLAAVLLSDAIGAEIRQRTLETLLVTPIRSSQIVIGKLASKLLQTASLLAISLPLLAVVRVFGGVPWDFVVAALCITASASIFTGSLSLLCSVNSRHLYDGVLWVLLWYLVVWILLPIVATAVSGVRSLGGGYVLSFLQLTNPLVTMASLEQAMMGRMGRAFPPSPWLWHCLVLLALASVLLLWAMRRVRRIARTTLSATVEEPREEPASQTRRSMPQKGGIRPVTGSPVVWKECRTPLFKAKRRIVFFLGAACVVSVLLFLIVLAVLNGPVYIVLFPIVLGLQLIFVIDLAVGAAGAIAKEREARTWPILLTTPLNNGEIVWGKAIGVFRRNLPLLASLLLLYPLMFYANSSSTRGPLQSITSVIVVPCNLAGLSVFLLGVGLYFSVRLRTRTAAVLATFATYYLPKLFFCGFLSPLFAMSTGMMAAMAKRNGGAAAWWGLVVPAIHVAMGLLFMGLAVRQVRRNIF